MIRYRLVLHISFLVSMYAVFESYPKVKNQFQAKLQQVMADPTAAGGRMKGIANPALQGRVFKVHIGASGGHRLIYIVHDKGKIVLPIFLSPEPRSTFDYKDVPWEEYCEEILSDFENNVTKNFKSFGGDPLCQNG